MIDHSLFIILGSLVSSSLRQFVWCHCDGYDDGKSVRWVVGSILQGCPNELFFIPASATRLV